MRADVICLFREIAILKKSICYNAVTVKEKDRAV
jgi:hypothetical protein